jgi:4-amino-4-deoxy-L-arabinose transferase-like glycosyltransferase
VFNALLSSISIFILYNLATKLYDSKTGIYSAIFASCSPILIYSTINFNSIIIYHILITVLFLYYVKIFSYNDSQVNNKACDIKNTVILGLTTGIFLYFRSELLGLMILIFIIFLFNKKVKHGIIYVFISLLIVSPWTIRNYTVFGRFIPITTSLGVNFLSGHGSDRPSEEYLQKLHSIKEDSLFEINQSNLSLQIGLNYIKSDPLGETWGGIKKIYSLWIIDNYRENAKHPLYIITWLPLLFLFITGLYYSLKIRKIRLKLHFLIAYMFFSTILVIVFFNIPRYQIQMSFILVPTAMYGFEKLLNHIKKKK